MTDMTIPLRALALLSLSLWSSGRSLMAQDENVLLFEGDPDKVVFELVTRVRYSTIITLPVGENILDFVVGDPEYWTLVGAANVAVLKPSAEGVETNIALVCESGRIYSFFVSEDATVLPNVRVRVVATADVDGDDGVGQLGRLRASSGDYQPTFVSGSSVAAYQDMAQQAAVQVEAIRAEADSLVAQAQREAERQITAFRSDYPTRIHFPYRLANEAIRSPFFVEAMWSDGQFTYLRSRAQETPALYERVDGEPSLVPYDLMADGLFIVRRVIDAGWLRIGDENVGWTYTPLNPLESPPPTWPETVTPGSRSCEVRSAPRNPAGPRRFRRCPTTP